MISHVIFDMDGTIVDSESLLFSALDTLSYKYALSAPFQLKTKLLGHPFKERALQLYNDLKFDRVLSLKHFISELISDCLLQVRVNGIHLMPGALELVEYFTRHNIPVAIATGNTRQSYDETAQRFHPFFSNFCAVVVSSESMSPKPSPNIYLTCAQQFPDKPRDMKNVLVFENSYVGALAAVSAGMQCVQVLDERLSARLDSNFAQKVIKSLEEFEPQEFGLPAK